MFEPASTKAAATEDADIAVSVASKPRAPRKPRVKAETITVVVRERKKVARFPIGWLRERHGLVERPDNLESISATPVINPAGRERKTLARLPQGWLRQQHFRQIQAVEQAVQTPAPGVERRKTARLPRGWQRDWHGRRSEPCLLVNPVRRQALRLPARWAEQIRCSQLHRDAPEPPVVLADTVKGLVMNTKRIVEAILFAANRPMTIKQIQETFPELEQPDTLTIQMALEDIARDYAERPVGLKHLASGYRFQIREGLSPWVTRLFEERPPRYSRALLETLSIIAYRQPVTRGEIEDIRGVTVSTSIIQTMLEREWIRVIGHKEVPGRPALYGTTKQFLDYFNLTTLNDLPTLQEVVDLDMGPTVQPTEQQEHRERSQTNTPQNPPAGEQASSSSQQDPGAQDDSLDAFEAETSGDDGESRTLH